MRVLPAYVKTYGGKLENRGGAMWFEAPAPPRVHQHYSWTRGWMGFRCVHRCPCGAIAERELDGLRWALLDKPRVGPLWMSRRRQRDIIATAALAHEAREGLRSEVRRNRA